MPIDPSTAFVSYSREDLEFVSRLAKDLKATGAKVWMDKLDIRPGQRWEVEAQAALDACRRMLVILSPASIASSNVLAEAAYAIDEGKEVIPVLYRECKIPFRLRPFQYADFRADYAIGLEELLASLSVKSAVTDVVPVASEENQRDTSDMDEYVRVAEEARREEERTRAAEQSRLAALAEANRKQREQADANQLAAQADAQRLAPIAEAERKRCDAAEEEARQEKDSGPAALVLPEPGLVSTSRRWIIAAGLTLGVVLFATVLDWLRVPAWQAQSSGTQQNLFSVALVSPQEG